MPKRHSRMLAVTAGALLIVGAASASPAEAKAGDVKVSGSCTGNTDWKLKLGPRTGAIETEFEVDSNRVGQRWSVSITDNGARVFTGTGTTVAPSGSFTVERRIPNRVGRDNIVARATNAATGESCVARASV
ncbi:MAG: hypothetical protein ABL966_07910 [Acidimicrobiales bacterium]